MVVYKKCFYLIFAFWGLLFGIANCQPKRTLHFETLTINNGLSQGYVSSIIQDKRGFMWMATSDGLDKFDGYNFTIYHKKSGDSNSLADDDLSFLYEDSKQRLWVCTRQNGVDLFDRKNQSFTHFRSGKSGLRSDNIYSIAEDKTGAFWIVTDIGIDRMVIRNKAVATGNDRSFLATHSVSITHINLGGEYKFPDYLGYYNRLFIDSRGNIFLLTDKNVLRLMFFEKTNTCKSINEFSFTGTGQEQLDMTEDTRGHGYILRTGYDLFKVEDYNFRSLKTLFKAGHLIGHMGVDSNRTLWIKSKDDIMRINLANNKAEIIAGDDNFVPRFIGNIMNFYFDRTGVAWIGTAGHGILKFNPDNEKFHHLLNNTYARAIYQVAGKDVVVNSELKFAYTDRKFGDTTRGDFKYLAAEKRNVWGRDPDEVIKSIVGPDILGQFPLRSRAYRFDPSSFVIDSYNSFWTVYGNSLYRLDKDRKVSSFDLPREFGKHAGQTYFIYHDEQAIWLGTTIGLLSFDIQKKTWAFYYHKDNDNTSLSNNYVHSIIDDSKKPGKYLWIGTRGGLNRLDKQTGKMGAYTTNNGLPNNVIYGILPDSSGCLWLSTNKGLSQFNTATGKCRNFTVSDGLQSNEFNSQSYCKLDDGTLVFGGVNGINYFNPAEIQPLKAPTVEITGFRLFNHPVDFRNEPDIFSSDLSYTKNVRLKHDQNGITIQFAAMDYRRTEAMQYRYMLNGFDGAWVYLTAGREANYTNLNPGTYTFNVEASNGDSIWSTYGQTLIITILPAWWQTWWFFTLAVAGTLLLLYVFYRFRVEQLLKVERVRNNIAKDLHDEIGSSLSAISIFSKVAREKLYGQSPAANEILEKISENVQGTMDAMSDIVWSVNAANDDFENVINRMREHAVSLLETRGYQLHFTADDSLNDIELEMNKRKDLFLIYKEALNNIVKYARGTEVWISITTTKKELILVVEDNGVGFDELKISKSSNGIRNMKARAQSLNGELKINTQADKGTRIELLMKN